ncbi:MAG: tRNA threonylcarbamoyladenosine dehydratase [Syntrophorhabdus sp. PtaU1.Bin050]|nr:MAG: tRNA threonylcarbamoyladenosine dehydratase [Syntrophorhabdus sp. PtaU1.Bin050]
MAGLDEIFSRSIMLYGTGAFERFLRSFVAVVGLGGVGSHAAEALVRAGFGRLRVIDCDIVKPSDINRQIIALSTNIGTAKVSAAKDRLLAINPHLEIDCRHTFFHDDTASSLITADLDFVIDAIDSLHPKGELIRYCVDRGIPIISSLGAAGRTDPLQVKVSKLDETTICPLARALRRHLRSHGISTDISVVYSTERPLKIHDDFAGPVTAAPDTYARGRLRQALPSLSTVPAIFGLIAANHVILNMIGEGRLPQRPDTC